MVHIERLSQESISFKLRPLRVTTLINVRGFSLDCSTAAAPVTGAANPFTFATILSQKAGPSAYHGRREVKRTWQGVGVIASKIPLWIEARGARQKFIVHETTWEC